jgi:hypothetical protein
MITAKDKPYSDLKVTKSIDKICIDIRMSWKRYRGLPFRSKFTVNMKWLHYDKFLVLYIIFISTSYAEHFVPKGIISYKADLIG